MSWHTIVHSDLPIIETCYSGVLKNSDLFDAVHETLALAQTHGRHLFLGDCTTLSGGHSMFDLYYLAKEISSNNISRTFKEAVLLSPTPTFLDKINFWETIGINRGFRVRIFHDRQKAVDWLVAE